MKKKVTSAEVLKMMPLRYQFLDEVPFEKRKGVGKRLIKMEYYNTDVALAAPSYRKTSKMLIGNEK